MQLPSRSAGTAGSAVTRAFAFALFRIHFSERAFAATATESSTCRAVLFRRYVRGSALVHPWVSAFVYGPPQLCFVSGRGSSSSTCRARWCFGVRASVRFASTCRASWFQRIAWRLYRAAGVPGASLGVGVRVRPTAAVRKGPYLRSLKDRWQVMKSLKTATSHEEFKGRALTYLSQART